jgi:hypothetical protein
MSSTMPQVIESVGEHGQRVERGFAWPEDIATDRLLGTYRALLSADEALERSRSGSRSKRASCARCWICVEITLAFGILDFTCPEGRSGRNKWEASGGRWK